MSKEQKEDITGLENPIPTDSLLGIPEFHLVNNSHQLEHKQYKLNHATRKSKSSAMSEADSISKEKDLSPYWNSQCLELQSKLWCPTEIDCAELDLILCNQSLREQVEKSPHLISQIQNKDNLTRNCSLDLPPVFAIPTMEKDRPKTKEVSRKIRLYPKNPQVWFEFLHASRRAYNLTIANFKEWEPGKTLPSDDQTNFRVEIRKQVHEEFPNSPSVLLDESVNTAYRTKQAVINTRKQGKSCDFRFRSRKDTKQSFVVQRLALGGPFPTFLKCHVTESIPSIAFGKMANVVFENGRWFLICKAEVVISEVESQDGEIVACDPGVRTFITTYSLSSCEKIGSGFARELLPMFLKLDKLISQKSKFTKSCPKGWKDCHKQRFRYFQKRIFSLRNKLNDLVNDLHKRTADFLTRKYDIILLPTFEVSDMVNKLIRKISSKSVRSMLSLSHYKFKLFLKWVAYKRGKQVIDCNEAYTSKTDSRTGEIVNLQGKKTINGLCRDVNGARGILLRALVT